MPFTDGTAPNASRGARASSSRTRAAGARSSTSACSTRSTTSSFDRVLTAVYSTARDLAGREADPVVLSTDGPQPQRKGLEPGDLDLVADLCGLAFDKH